MIDNKVEDIAGHIEEIMKILDIKRDEGNKLTPLRISKMFTNELFRNRNDLHLDELKSSIKTFKNESGSNEMIIIKGIEFSSICEHHWLPFSGIVNVGYIPYDRIIGLSKIPRIVEYFSKKPQLQENLVNEICYTLYDSISPQFVIVHAVATHDCVMCRGIESRCETDTINILSVSNDPLRLKTLKEEFFSRISLKG